MLLDYHQALLVERLVAHLFDLLLRPLLYILCVVCDGAVFGGVVWSNLLVEFVSCVSENYNGLPFKVSSGNMPSRNRWPVSFSRWLRHPGEERYSE